MEAKYLKIGQRFESKYCKETMRNCVCLRISQTAVYAMFDERKGINEPWKKVYESIARSCEVEPLAEVVSVERNDIGELLVAGEAASTGKRGRKSKEIEFPQTPFTIAELVKKYDVTAPCIYSKIKAMGDKIVVVEEKRAEGQRGRATKVYQLLDFINEKKTSKKRK